MTVESALIPDKTNTVNENS